MILRVFEDKRSLGKAAAERAALVIRDAIRNHGTARVIAATGASQFEFLDDLVNMPDVHWTRVELFQLDEYVGLPMTHPASFCKYLQERLISKTGITNHHLMDGAGDPSEVIRRTSAAIRNVPLDAAFVGIGENGHLAFNDPPADFVTSDPYIVAQLDEACRRQQVGEGWFSTLEEVPTRAISMSVRQILKAREIICVVPDGRKAAAVKSCYEGPISPMAPASVLRGHSNTTIYLDQYSVSLLDRTTLAKYSAATERNSNSHVLTT